MTKEFKKNHQGFTLVEVLLAMAVLAIISLPLMGYFSDTVKYNQLTKNKQKAVLAAQSIMEDLKVSSGVEGIYHFYEGNIAWKVTEISEGKDYIYEGPWEKDGTKYDIKIETKAKTEEQAQIIPMSPQTDVVITETGVEKTEAIAMFLLDFPEDSQTTIEEGLTRIMRVEFSKLDSVQIQIKAEYIYTYKGISHSVLPGSDKTEMAAEDLRHVYFIFNYDNEDTQMEVIGADFELLKRLYLVCHGAPDTFRLGTSGLMGAGNHQVVSNIPLDGGAPTGHTVGLVEKKEMVTFADLTVSVYQHREVQNYNMEDLLVQLTSVKGG